MNLGGGLFEFFPSVLKGGIGIEDFAIHDLQFFLKGVPA